MKAAEDQPTSSAGTAATPGIKHSISRCCPAPGIGAHIFGESPRPPRAGPTLPPHACFLPPARSGIPSPPLAACPYRFRFLQRFTPTVPPRPANGRQRPTGGAGQWVGWARWKAVGFAVWLWSPPIHTPQHTLLDTEGVG